ncbi:MAG TPA: Ig-like domain-containing protein [Verrucomicrobiota bacterium]|nr:Ig-like domain-containing protein [Verrucomicrobiota bacterium]HNU51598.1 Ig-like domain-containing protein [Verrucomicrobiota bacterium]
MKAPRRTAGLIPAALLLTIGCSALQSQTPDPSLVPVVTLAATPVEIAEPSAAHPGAAAVVCFFRTGDPGQELTVFYKVAGTAENGVDYSRIGDRITFPAGASAQRIVIQPLADAVAEGIETIVLRLTPAAAYRVGTPGAAKVGLRDGPAPVSKAELRLVQPRDGASFQAPTRIGIEAAAVDPEGFIYTVDFFADDLKIGTSQICTLVPPPPGTVAHHAFLWTDPPVGQHLITARATTSAGFPLKSRPITVAVRPIQPPAPATVVTVEATDPQAREPGGTWIIERNIGTFTFSRTGTVRQPLTVTYAIGGTAGNGIDYARLSGTVTFPAGVATARVPVLPLPDAFVEEKETVAVVVQPGADYEPGRPAEAVVALLDTPPGPAPTARLKITKPRHGTLFAPGAEIPIAVTAVDPEGYIARVEFFADGKSLGVSELAFLVAPDPGTPIHHPFVWSEAPLGRHLLTAQAKDSHDRLVVSQAVGIAVTDGRTPPPGGGVVQLADGRLLLGLNTPAADPCTVEVSTDLTTWTPLATGVAEDGLLSFIDSDPARGRAAFYRVVPVR